MKINYVSDLHTEFDRLGALISGEKGFPTENETKADVLVLAGDIGVEEDSSWIEDAAKNYDDVVYVMGNHEYYHGRYPDTLNALREKFKGTNVHVLENESVDIKGVTFHGATLWTDMGRGTADPEGIKARVDGGMNDFRIIRTNGGKDRFTANYASTLHAETVGYLLCCVEEGDVVVTHHAPSFGSMHPRYVNDTAMNHGYMSNLEWLLEDKKPALWFHGHVHNNFDYLVGETRVLCNPRGYARYEENPSFDRNLTVEV